MRPLVCLSVLLLVVTACSTQPHAKAAAVAQRPATAPCLGYGPDTVSLTGILRRATFPGPPNYEDIGTGDVPETGYYLDLAQAICTAGGRDAALAESHTDVRSVQLVLDSTRFAMLRPSLNARVTLYGTLLPAHTGHHHAPVLLVVILPTDAHR